MAIGQIFQWLPLEKTYRQSLSEITASNETKLSKQISHSSLLSKFLYFKQFAAVQSDGNPKGPGKNLKI